MNFMHSERSYFIDYQALTVSQFIYDIDSDCLQAFDIENVIVFDDKKHRRTLKSVLHAVFPKPVRLRRQGYVGVDLDRSENPSRRIKPHDFPPNGRLDEV